MGKGEAISEQLKTEILQLKEERAQASSSSYEHLSNKAKNGDETSKKIKTDIDTITQNEAEKYRDSIAGFSEEDKKREQNYEASEALSSAKGEKTIARRAIEARIEMSERSSNKTANDTALKTQEQLLESKKAEYNASSSAYEHLSNKATKGDKNAIEIKRNVDTIIKNESEARAGSKLEYPEADKKLNQESEAKEALISNKGEKQIAQRAKEAQLEINERQAKKNIQSKIQGNPALSELMKAEQKAVQAAMEKAGQQEQTRVAGLAPTRRGGRDGIA